MGLRKLKLSDKRTFEEYLGYNARQLSAYHFANIFSWGGLFDITWEIIADKLCVFFKDGMGCFLYLWPMGKNKANSEDILQECFAVMDGLNRNPVISRVENITEDELKQCPPGSNYQCYEKPGDYLYLRSDIAGLKGNAYKSKRSSYNHFVRNFDVSLRPFTGKDGKEAALLYCQWAKQRLRGDDPLYDGMIDDSAGMFARAVKYFHKLGMEGLCVRHKQKLIAYSFGYRLSAETFCIMAETCDLSYKGISEFMFREFAGSLKGYRWINAMDDSGLESLARAKRSWKPAGITANFVIRKKPL